MFIEYAHLFGSHESDSGSDSPEQRKLYVGVLSIPSGGEKQNPCTWLSLMRLSPVDTLVPSQTSAL